MLVSEHQEGDLGHYNSFDTMKETFYKSEN